MQRVPGIFRYLKPTTRATSSRRFHNSRKNCSETKVIGRKFFLVIVLDSKSSNVRGASMCKFPFLWYITVILLLNIMEYYRYITVILLYNIIWNITGCNSNDVK